MAQMSWRASDELVERVKRAAAREGRSMNEFVTAVLDAATDPDLVTDEAQRVRERLERAGLLVRPEAPRRRPSADRVAAARAAAGRGTSLSEIVRDGRG